KIKPKANSMFSMELFSSGFDRVRKAVTESHNVLLVLGNNPLIGARENYDRKTLSVTERQQKLSDLVISLNENAVLLFVSGYPYAVDNRFNSVLHTGHNGPEMGTAVAKVLFGDISPAGRCPMTWYSSENELGSIKDYNIIRTESTYRYYRGEPVFPFGHGLSYTAFRYSALKLNKKCFEPNERCEVTFEIKNIGIFDSDEVVQLYVKSPEFSSAVPIKELKAFKRVFVPTEKAVPITLSFDIADLAIWDLNKNCRTVYAGTYEIQVGSSSEEILRTAEIKVHGENYQGLDVRQPVPAAASWEYVGVEFLADKQLNEYALLENSQSSITFENCAMKGEKNVEIIFSNPSTKTKVLILEADKNEVLAEIEVPTTGSLSNFTALSAKMNPISGKHKLKIKAGGILSLKSFRLF
ncbi:MAG: glycoside hydrolase family 3 C-terminal domain-containing protein, partial [[Eubacterium] saphenum]|nr:glycoside hydrolase family 3 C-terminal domain-containing protein [[Eubacterium] saphenum]